MMDFSSESMQASGHGVSRRQFAALGAVTAALVSDAFGMRTALASHAGQLRQQGKSMILLWMQGGPSQFETLDPKPGTQEGGPTKDIQTSVAGIRLADNFPKVAQQMSDIAIVRSMTNKEGSHPRATYQLHTGYVPAGSVRHPSFGSCIAQQISQQGCDLPPCVSIGPTQGAGFLGMDYEPFVVARPGQLPDNVASPVVPDRLARRTNLLGQLTGEFSRTGSEQLAKTHTALYSKASKLIVTPETAAFDISSEPAALKAAYGESNFGRGCLLARRLIEQGVSFVEVRSNNWDTHQDNFAAVARNSSEVDPATAALIVDLRDRGLLANTLVVWMGEFGRTPKINPREGRDHYPRVFSMMMAGCGIRGGQVYGSSSADGSVVQDNPVTVPDLLRTQCQALGLNPDLENMSPQGRPLKVVDGGKVIDALLS